MVFAVHIYRIRAERCSLVPLCVSLFELVDVVLGAQLVEEAHDEYVMLLRRLRNVWPRERLPEWTVILVDRCMSQRCRRVAES